MKTLVFLCGPNGIGKTTVSNALLARPLIQSYGAAVFMGGRGFACGRRFCMK